MKKKVISLVVLLTIIFNFSCPVFAQIEPSQYAKYSNKKDLPFTNENVNNYEKRQMDYSEYENAVKTGIQPYVEDPGEGAYQLIYTTPWSSGYIYEDTNKSASIINTILDASFTIGSYFMSTGTSIVMNIARFVYGMSSPDIYISGPGHIKLSHSYSYVSKLGQIYDGSTWLTKVDIEKRMWFRHEYASWSTNSGYTKTGTMDFTPDTGYSSIHTDYVSSLYNDNEWIYTETLHRYNANLPPYVSAWTH